MVKKHKPNISPDFAMGEEMLMDKVRKCYQPGETLGNIREKLNDLETYKNFRRVRGFAAIVERNSTFKGKWTVDPLALRLFLFEQGYVTDGKERNAMLKKAAEHFNADIKTVERDFWADKEENYILVKPPYRKTDELLKRYNLSLLQTLLFDALGLRIIVGGNYQRIFGMIKYLGLMYEAEKAVDGQTIIRVTGPASLFKKTKKYGTSLARLVPHIIRAGQWRIQAKVETTVAGEKRIYDFEMDDSDGNVFPEYVEEESFDSEVEKEFATHFRSVNQDWNLLRESTILTSGPFVMIPDFCFERRGRKLYMEIVGFWTPEYLKKKISKVNNIDEKIFLAVDKNLECTGSEFKGKNVDVIFYDKKIPIMEVVKRLHKIEEEQDKDELKKLEKDGLKELEEKEIKKDVVLLQEIAEKKNVGVNAVRGYLEKHGMDWVLVGNKIVKPNVIEEIKHKIDEMADRKASNVEEVLRSYDLGLEALEKMGYHVIWRSLNPDDAEVRHI